MNRGFAPPLCGSPLGPGPLGPPAQRLRRAWGCGPTAPQGPGWGPRPVGPLTGHSWGTPPPLGASRFARARPDPFAVCARLGRAPRGVSAPRLAAGRAFRPDQRPRPSLFAHSASPLAPGPLPLRGAASARRARRRFAGPVRRIPPSAPLGPRRPRPSRLPPGSPARPLLRARPCGASPSRGSRWPRLPGASPRFASGSLAGGRPRFVSGSPLVSAWPRRVPPGAPASRLRGRLAPAPGGARGLWAALFCAPPPGAFFPRPRPRGLRAGVARCPGSLFSTAVPGRQVLPQAPSRPPPPPGAGGGARLICGWVRRFLPPGFRRSLLPVSARFPAPRLAVHNPEIVNP